MRENSKEFVMYESFDELPEELKEKFKSGAEGWNLKQAKDGYVDLINLLSNRGDELVGSYVKNSVKTQVKFDKCSHIVDISPSRYKSGDGCAVCRGLQVQHDINDLATTHPDLAKEWHPTKNGELTPHEVTHGSGKKVWWQCEKGHEWKETVTHRTNMGCNCPYCSNHRVLRGYNDIATTHPRYTKYFVNVENAYTHTYSSGKKVNLKCPICGHVKAIGINTLTSQGFSCDLCSDGIPYPEKLMASILSRLEIEFTKQLSFDNGKHNYDFYLSKYNTILETHGEQHYKGWLGNNKDLIQQQENDRIKRELAIANGIKPENYHEIDCRYSTLEWCRPNIEKTLGNHVDVSILTDEDWRQADIQAQKSLKIEVCKYWKENKEIDSSLTPQRVADVFGISNSTTWSYLKWGDRNSLCTYNGKYEARNAGKRNSKLSGMRKVKLIYLIKSDGKSKWFKEVMSMGKMSKETGISLSAIKNGIDNGALKYHRSSKYDPKYIGSYIVSAEVYDNQHQTNQNT